MVDNKISINILYLNTLNLVGFSRAYVSIIHMFLINFTRDIMVS